MTSKQRIETLLTAAEHLLGILQHKRLDRQELADYRTIKAYVAAMQAELNKESEAQS